MSVVDREALKERRAQIGPLIEPIDGVPYGTMVSTDDPLVAAVDAVLEGEAIWWCVPYHEHGNMSEPCVAGSTHDRPYECRWVVVVPIGEK